MHLRNLIYAFLAGLLTLFVACDLMETPKARLSSSPIDAAARAQAVLDSAKAYQDSLNTVRKADSILALTARNSWLTDSAGFAKTEKVNASTRVKDSLAALKVRKADSIVAAKHRKTDSILFTKDSTAAAKTLSKDSVATAKKMATDSVLYAKAALAAATKYTKDSLACVAAARLYATKLVKDSAAVAAAQAVIDAETDSTKPKVVASNASNLAKAQAQLGKDLAAQQKAIAAAAAKMTKDSLAGEVAKQKILIRRVTDSIVCTAKYSKDSLSAATKLKIDSIGRRSRFVSDSTTLSADSIAADIKYAADTLAMHTTASAKATKKTADSLAIFHADSVFLFRKAVVSFSPVPGSYSIPQNIALSSAYTGTGATILYTIDGTTPDGSSTVYTGPISLNLGATIKAIAAKPGYDTSVVIGGKYVIGTTPLPTFLPVPGTYVDSQKIVVTCGSDSVYFTTDGTSPTTSSPKKKSGDTIFVNKTQTIKLMGFSRGKSSSALATGIFTIVADTPTLSFTNSRQKVSIATQTLGASIRYTTDGSIPNASSTLYTDSFPVVGGVTVKAIAIKTGLTNSVVGQKIFKVLPKASFVFDRSIPAVWINCPGADSVVFTMDGSIPSYTHGFKMGAGNGFVLSNPDTLIAMGFRKTGDTTDSPIDTVMYLRQATPTFVLTTKDSTRVAISSLGADSIYYTTDGTTPTSARRMANGDKIALTGAKTVKAIAAKAGKLLSLLDSAIYTIQTTPTISLGADAKTVTITSAGSDSIFYTLNNVKATATKSATNLKYTAPFVLSAGDTVIAIAVKTGAVMSLPDTGFFAQQAMPTVALGSDGMTVTFTSTGADSIMYTRDKSVPTISHGTQIATGGSLVLAGADTILAVAVKAGSVISAIDTARFLAQAAPTFGAGAGITITAGGAIDTTTGHNGGIGAVTLTSAGADGIYYTINGSVPTTSSPIYTGPITVKSAMTIRAIAVKAGKVYGASTKAYTIQ